MHKHEHLQPAPEISPLTRTEIEVTRRELDMPSGIFDEGLGREMTNGEFVGIMKDYHISSRPEDLSDAANDVNSRLNPSNIYHPQDADEIVYAIVRNTDSH